MPSFNDRLSALYEISVSLQSLELEKVLRMILEGVTSVIGFDRARLYIVDEENRLLKCVMAVGLDLESAGEIVLDLVENSSVVANSVINREAYIVRDSLSDPRVNLELIKRLKIKSFVAVPMIGRERVVGVISADNLYSDREITDEDFKLLVTFVNQAGVAIENAEMYSKLKELNENLERRIEEALKDLRESQLQLMQSEKLAALGQIAAGVAHELRNPLTSIKILVHSLVDEFSLDKRRPEDVRVINFEIKKMEELVTKFLNFARRNPPFFEEVNIDGIIDNVLSLLEYRIGESNIILKLNLGADTKIMADKDSLHQLFLNLILNSMQAMPKGGELRVSTTRNDDRLMIQIEDTGVGMSDSILEHIFDPFFTTKDEGTGLGLPIVKRIVDEHKGNIDVSSTPNKGTTVSISLPIAR